MPTNYNNGTIYKIVNNIDNMIYLGSTTDRLCNRMTVHRLRAKKNNSANLYKHMRKLGVHNFMIVLIEAYPCLNKMQLLKRERYYFQSYDKKNTT